MKKSWLTLVVLSLLVTSIASVSADTPRQGAERLVDSVKDIFEPIIGAVFGGVWNEYLFEAFLFFLIALSFIYVSLSRMEIFAKKPVVIWTITLAVSLLSTRFLAESDWVSFVLLPYNILGVALLSVIPFVIFFFFIHSFDEPIIRKWGWAAYIIIYLALWYRSLGELGQIAYIYLFVALLGLIMIASDKAVRGIRVRGLIRQGLNETVARKLTDLQTEIDEDVDRLSKAPPHLRKHINKRLSRNIDEQKRISKELKV